MAAGSALEVWLRGSLPDYTPVLMPVAQALLQAREDVERVAAQATAIAAHLGGVLGGVTRGGANKTPEHGAGAAVSCRGAYLPTCWPAHHDLEGGAAGKRWAGMKARRRVGS